MRTPGWWTTSETLITLLMLLSLTIVALVLVYS